MRPLFLIISTLMFLLLLSSPVKAQTSEATTAALIDNNATSTIEQQRQSLRQLYREQIQAYQTTYRKFSLAKSQFQKLDTLASLEEAVASTRDAFKVRDELLITYLDILLLELQVNPSYEDSIKQEYMDRITELRNELVAFNQLVLNSQDRQALAERATGFVPLGTTLRDLSFQTRKLIFLGKFRALAGLAQQLTQEVKSTHEKNPVSALKQGERQRAYQELSAADSVVQTAWDKSVSTYAEEVGAYGDSYSRFIITLSPIQTGLIRWYTLLEQTTQL